MTTGIVIPAHMGSTRFPGKPLADIGGKPLLSYAIGAAEESGLPWVIATSDDAIREWCRGTDSVYYWTGQVRNGTERAALANQSLQWDRVIVLQCDEPDVTGEDLHSFSKLAATPSTMACIPSDSDWLNAHSVFVRVHGYVAMSFERGSGIEVLTNRIIWRHVGVYLYDKELLERYLRHAMTPAEVDHSLEQLRTMALGCAWAVHKLNRKCRSINVPEDAKKFT